MGHRFSKTAANNIAAVKTRTNKANEQQKQQLQAFNTITRTTNIIPIPSGSQQQQQQQFLGPTFNLQIHESSNITCSSTGNCDSGARTASINSLTTAAAILQKPQPHQQLQQQQQQQYNTNSISSSSLNSINNLSCSGGRQIIIKIQLAKMENGNETSTATTTPLMVAEHLKNTSLENIKTDCNLNSTEPLTLSSSSSSLSSTMAPINFNLNSSNNSTSTNIISSDSNNCMSMPNPGVVPTKITATGLTSLTSSSTLSPPTTSVFCRTAGSSTNQNNNIYLNANLNGNSSSSITATRLERPERLQFNDEIFEQNIGEIVEYCEVLEPQQQPSTALAATPTININNMQMLTISEETDNNGANNACCRRKSKSLAANGNGSSTASFSSSSSNNNNTGTKTKNRCRKCSCRDALRRFLDPSLSRSSSTSNKAGKQQQQKEQKRNKSQDRHSTASTNTSNQLFNNNNSIHSNMTTTNNASTPGTTTSATAAVVMPPVATNQVSLWAPATTTNGNDVVIPLTTTPAALPPQFVVVQCAIVNSSNSLPPAPTASTLSFNSNSSSTLTNNNNALISTIPNDLSPTTSSTSTINEFKNPSNSTNIGGPTVHSQVDFVHYLVPDLERIMNSSFYWGKMDRYEAERLLEGKPEGTFLLRDSAQEEFLFSVTFRKYGRSLHARIEQSGHRFSFDCHDPCVFTAPTVTGLLEHYKDPACVMFFEPMLTIPLHRKNCFSLQKLCRATIVSNTTYDGINELELPARLKAYLKEYHYKQKLRVKFNEPSYTIHFK